MRPTDGLYVRERGVVRRAAVPGSERDFGHTCAAEIIYEKSEGDGRIHT